MDGEDNSSPNQQRRIIMHCYRCYSQMVKVTIINTWEREQKALVCTSCGKISSKDKLILKAGGKHGRKK